MAQTSISDEEQALTGSLTTTKSSIGRRRVLITGLAASGFLLVLACLGHSALSQMAVRDIEGKATANQKLLQEVEQRVPANEQKFLQEELAEHVPAARTKVRAAILELKEDGATVADLKERLYSRRNLGCAAHEAESDALTRCLAELKSGFTPRELFDLLDLKSDHDCEHLQKLGLDVKTSNWEEGKEEVMCWESGDKSGCVFHRVTVVQDDTISLKHVQVDPKTGRGSSGDHKFTIYSMFSWKAE